MIMNFILGSVAFTAMILYYWEFLRITYDVIMDIKNKRSSVVWNTFKSFIYLFITVLFGATSYLLFSEFFIDIIDKVMVLYR